MVQYIHHIISEIAKFLVVVIHLHLKVIKINFIWLFDSKAEQNYLPNNKNKSSSLWLDISFNPILLRYNLFKKKLLLLIKFLLYNLFSTFTYRINASAYHPFSFPFSLKYGNITQRISFWFSANHPFLNLSKNNNSIGKIQDNLLRLIL